MIGSPAISRKIRPATPVQAIKSVLREAERADQESKRATGATGATLLRFSRSPVDTLVLTKGKDRIGPIELWAAHDISIAVRSLTAGVQMASGSWERVDRAHGDRTPAAILDAQKRWTPFARHWAMRRKRGDWTLEILIQAVVEEKPFYLIDEDIGLRHGKAKQVMSRGLRDYAARAGWVGGRLRELWIVAASNSFKLCPI